MELYDRRNEGEQDPSMEWGPPGGVSGLEESMMRLGIGSMESYPERPGMPDCSYYMRTGTCGFGSRCRYNHPHDRSAAAAAMRSTVGEYPERVGEPFCRFYMKTGTCKFGMSCKFHHPKNEGGSINQVPVNIYGYPLRPGENECSYYLKTGQCKFGVTCKFHHPQPAGASGPASAPTFYPMVQSPSAPPPEQYGGASTSWRVGRPPLLPGSYLPGSYGPVVVSPGVVPVPGWSPYSAPVSPVLSPGAQPTIGMSSLYGIAQHSPSTPPPAGQYPTLLQPAAAPTSSEQPFPERPGQPECEYYMRNGDCKFGPSCKYHHPKQRVAPYTNSVLSPIGLPLRPGVQPCTFYLQHGICKFGPSCKFDHPMATMRYSPSASSLTDMPVAPYPVGTSQATLAPSFSSSDLHPDLIAGARRDSYSTTMPPSGTASSSSVGLVFSQTIPVSLSDAQLSSQITSPLSSSRSTMQGIEVRRSSS